MTYSDTVAHSWGFITLIGVGFCLLIFTWPVVRFLWFRFKRRQDVKVKPLSHIWNGFALLFTLVLAGWFGAVITIGDAEAAKSGEAVRPIRDPVLKMMLLDVRAQPVMEIVSVTEAKTTISTAGLTYLGNYDRSFVLYCVRDGRILKISMERFVLRTSPFESTPAAGAGKTCGKARRVDPIPVPPPETLTPNRTK
jgi:hypothetical protein